MRIIKHGRDKPFAIRLGDLPQLKGKIDENAANAELHICACGLSKHKPFCDGSHKLVQQEEQGKIFVYSSDGERKELGKDTAFDQAASAPNEYE
ncbi:MAG: CDGSH iron-sulfur domain-containing protein [Candidatus Micrarchaeia archaeon]